MLLSETYVVIRKKYIQVRRIVPSEYMLGRSKDLKVPSLGLQSLGGIFSIDTKWAQKPVISTGITPLLRVVTPVIHL